jgi:choline dehydrogenase-like flavoprotein
VLFNTKVSESFNQADSTVFDVCIIGSGPAGTVLGVNLVKAGIKTVIVESGSNITSWLILSVIPEQKFLEAHRISGQGDVKDFIHPILKNILIPHRIIRGQ